ANSSAAGTQAKSPLSTGAKIVGAAAVGATGVAGVALRSGTGTTALGGPAVEAGRKLAEEIKALKEQQKEHEGWILGVLKNRFRGDRDVEEGADAQRRMLQCEKDYPNSATKCFTNPEEFSIPPK
ncbi:MAG: hypothetical protein H7833_20890, partial [Magnetococcus sp. DMHC-1]